MYTPSRLHTRERIILLGDSLILRASEDNEGFPRKFQKAYEGKADIITRGYPFGFSTSWFVYYLEAIIKQFFPQKQKTLWILAWGLCDMLCDPKTSEPYSSLEDYGQNYDRIIKMIRRYDPGAEIIILVPLPLDRERWNKNVNGKISEIGETIPCKGFEALPYERCMGYSKKAVTVAFRNNVVALDMMLHSDNWRTLLGSDGAHFSSKGHSEIFDNLTNLITLSLPKWRPTQLLGDNIEFDPFSVPPIRNCTKEDNYDEFLELRD